jgi:hypothetical protein
MGDAGIFTVAVVLLALPVALVIGLLCEKSAGWVGNGHWHGD